VRHHRTDINTDHVSDEATVRSGQVAMEQTFDLA
jgi:hypothetical protein